jgi:UDP-glucose 4-epimerase
MDDKFIPKKPYRALITGGAGFIGSHLAEALLERGHAVTVIDDLSTGRFENIQHLVDRPGFRFAIDSITNAAVMDRLASECDIIFHLAAAVGVMLIVEKPVHTIETNVMGTEAVLKAALRYRAKVLIASTSEVYGKGNRVPFREDDDIVLGPTSRSRWAYAASKMVDEFLALAYHREKGLPVVVFRLFNTVGPRQTGQYGMVIPRFVQQALKGDSITVYGDGSQTRCFLHVSDAVEAILALADCPQAVGQVFNVGATEEVSIATLAARILELVQIECRGSKVQDGSQEIVFIPYEEAYAVGFEDMQRRLPDIEKVCDYTGWKPRRMLEEALRDILREMG